MAENALTLEQTVYGALRADLQEKRHIDMVFTYYNEDTAKTEYSAGCHRFAIAAKSRFLHHLFLFHGHEDDDLHLVLVGNGHMTAAEDLIGLLYDPGKAGKDITLWEDEKVRLTPRAEVEEPWEKVETVLIKEEVGSGDENVWDGGPKQESKCEDDDEEEYKPLKRKRRRGRPRKRQRDNDDDECSDEGDDEDYDLGEGTQKRKLSQSRVQEMKLLQETEDKLGLSLDKVKQLVAEDSDVIGYYEHRLRRIRTKFHSLSYDGEPIPYACCMDCRKVLSFQPTKPTHLYNHMKLCEEENGGHDAKPAQNATILSHLFRTGSDRVERYSSPEGVLPRALSQKFDCVRYEAKEVPWAICKHCGMVLSTKFKALGLKNLELHKCNTQHGKSAGGASFSRDIDVAHLEALIKKKHPDVVTKVMSSLLGNFNRYLK